jgi:Ca2+-binding RTX toxin-like protein
VILALPCSAPASSVSITSTPGQLVYTGDAASNTVTISWDGTVYTIADTAGVTANPASGCVAPTTTSATCPDLAVTSILARLAPTVNGPDSANSITLSATLPDDEPVTVDGAAGADTFTGQAAAETFNGHSGDDVGSGGDGGDTLNGDAGGDSLSGGNGDDLLNGNNAVNTSRRSDGDDILNGGGGSDVITGHWGSDVIDGGTGTDRADYGDKEDFDPIGVSLDDDTTRNDGGASDGTIGNRDIVRTNVERVFGGAGADTISDDITSSTVANTFNGRGGSDVMSGGLGADILQGFDGRDRLTGGPGVDTITSGNDDDQIFARDGEAETAIDCGAGTDTAQTDAAGTVFDTAIGCETVDGG